MSEIPSLEVMLRHVETNNIWEPVDKVAKIKEDVALRYRAYEAVKTGILTPAEAERQYGINKTTLRSWKKGAQPYFLQDYGRRLLPSSVRERRNFAGLLGVLAANKKHEGESCKLSRSIKNPSARRRVKRVMEASGESPKERGTILEIHGKRRIKMLNYCLAHRSHVYISTESEKIRSTQNFFDTLETPVRYVRGRIKYDVHCRNPLSLRLIVQFLFELGIFPRIDIDTNTFQIDGDHDLRRFYQLNLDRNQSNRNKLSEYLESRPLYGHHVDTYYNLRKRVKELYKKGEKFVWSRLAKEFGIKAQGTVRVWVADIVEEEEGVSKYPQRIPPSAKNYLRIVQFLGPFRNNNVVVFPFEGELYYLPRKVELEYCKEILAEELLRDDLDFVYDELKRKLNGSDGRQLEMKIKGKVMKEVTAA